MLQENTEFQNTVERYRQEMMDAWNQTSHGKNTTIDAQTLQNASDNIENEVYENAIPTEEVTDIGQLQVRVSTENQAVPIPGAVVTINKPRENGVELIRTIITDESGSTPIIDLPTKDRQLSMIPGNVHPYIGYNVDVTAEGYYPKRFINLPIYGGVVALQSVSMIPLPENGDNDIVLSYPQSAPTL